MNGIAGLQWKMEGMTDMTEREVLAKLFVLVLLKN